QWNAEGKIVKEEPAFTFSTAQYEKSISKEMISKIIKIEKRKNLSYCVDYEQEGRQKSLECSMVIFMSKHQGVKLFPFLADKLIPVTLSSFEFTKTKKCPLFSLAIFNGGADFAVQ